MDINKIIEFQKFYSQSKRQSQEKFCIWTEIQNNHCHGKIVNAHSIQRGKVLEGIAESGYIFNLGIDLATGLPNIKFEKTGLKKFSTFSGFCGYHDKSIFQPIEDKYFSSTNEQMLLYAYRAVCREYHAKIESNNLNQNFIKSTFSDFQNTNCIAELKSLNNFIARNILTKKYDCLTLYWKKLKGNYPIACNTCFIPYFDLDGNPIYSEKEYIDIQKKPQKIQKNPNIMINIFNENSNTFVLIAHTKGMKKKYGFVEQLLASNEQLLTAKLSNILITNCENIAFSPKYVMENFTDDERKYIESDFQATLLPFYEFYETKINLFKT